MHIMVYIYIYMYYMNLTTIIMLFMIACDRICALGFGPLTIGSCSCDMKFCQVCQNIKDDVHYPKKMQPTICLWSHWVVVPRSSSSVCQGTCQSSFKVSILRRRSRWRQSTWRLKYSHRKRHMDWCLDWFGTEFFHMFQTGVFFDDLGT